MEYELVIKHPWCVRQRVTDLSGPRPALCCGSVLAELAGSLTGISCGGARGSRDVGNILEEGVVRASVCPGIHFRKLYVHYSPRSPRERSTTSQLSTHIHPLLTHLFAETCCSLCRRRSVLLNNLDHEISERLGRNCSVLADRPITAAPQPQAKQVDGFLDLEQGA